MDKQYRLKDNGAAGRQRTRSAKFGRACVVACACAPYVFLHAQSTHTSERVSYGRDIAPVFKAHCISCHSGTSPAGKLDLATTAGIARGGASGDLWLVKDPDSSLLLKRITGKLGPQMPMGMPALNQADIDAIRSWIRDGASFDNGIPRKHWAYVAPVKPAVPELHSSWVRNPIDAFVLARLRSEHLHPAPRAAKETLIRRVTFDLTGLPPTPQEIDAFVADSHPDAYERLVDKLLASPHYGEKQAVGWLDLARYADSDGYEKDLNRTNWKYRDWVIDAFNRDLPYDRFTIDQIAGDLLPNATLDDRIATGFHRNTMFNREGGVNQEEAHFAVVEDRAETTATVWLGSTLGCARCHDHKYDPFLQRDYYKMVAFYNNTAILPQGPKSVGEEKWFEAELAVPSPEQARQQKLLEKEIASLDRSMDPRTTDQVEFHDWIDHLKDTVAWTPIVPQAMTATNGSVLETGPDGVVAVSGKAPDKDTYRLEFPAQAEPITGLRLEALADPSLPSGGPGRSPNGNFVLSGLNVLANGKPVIAEIAAADFSQTDFPAIDAVESVPEKGWAVLGQIGKSHQIVFQFDRPIPAGSKISVVLAQVSHYPMHLLGKFRLSSTDSLSPLNAVAPSRIVELASSSTATSDKQNPELLAYYRSVSPFLAHLRARQARAQQELDKLKAEIPTTLVMQENASAGLHTEWVRHRGEFSSRTEQVTAGTPAVLPPLKAARPDRLALAKWLVSTENPLTARVEVNRLWEECFGKGIVETSEDFGTRCSPPTHPELLDWLACKFMAEKWDIKAMLKLIVTSATYRQSSDATPMLIEKDPRNLLFARGPRFRLDAESIHDEALAASGLLSTKIGGPSVYPSQPAGVWDTPYNDERWMPSIGEDRYRRGLYTFWKRTSPYPAFMAFDATSRESCTVRRTRTDTPLQALELLNDEFVMQASRALGKRMQRSAASDAARIKAGFRLCTARAPSGPELQRLETLLTTLKRRYTERPKDAAQVASDPTDAAWTLVGNVLLNLDETITKD